MQDHCSVGSSTHSRIGNSHHVRYALLQEFPRQGKVSDFRHSGIAAWPTVPQDKNACSIHFERGVVYAGMKLLNTVEDHRAPAMLHE